MAVSYPISPSYSLKSFSFTDFKGIKHLEISGLPSSASWIFLTGENVVDIYDLFLELNND